jgi:hypothetical protein
MREFPVTSADETENDDAVQKKIKIAEIANVKMPETRRGLDKSKPGKAMAGA